MPRPLSSSNSRPLSLALPLVGLVLLLVVGAIIWLGSTTPDATPVAYEKSVDVAR